MTKKKDKIKLSRFLGIMLGLLILMNSDTLYLSVFGIIVIILSSAVSDKHLPDIYLRGNEE